MQLSELFVSHKQVDPVKFEPTHNPGLFSNIYLNLDRAKRAASDPVIESTPESETSYDFSTWKVHDRYPSEPSTQQTSVVETSTPKPSTGRWENPYKGQKDKWVTDMKTAYRSLGLNDNAIKNLLAKNILESGWGNSAQGDYNFGNITTGNSWKGRFVQGKDKDANGNPTTPKFRAYDSLEDYVKDEVQFLTNLYEFNQNDDFDTFINKLQGQNTAGRKYAAARDYISSVRKIYNGLA